VKRLIVALTVFFVVAAFAHTATAITHQATIGNYYYEDDAQKDTTKIVVHVGDQITFTVRQQAVPGHTVDVDELNIHSPNLDLGQTFTTPPLTRAGNFYLYCRPHEARGHHTRLIVLATSTPVPQPRATPHPTAVPPHIVGTPATTPHTSPAPTASPKPSATLTPVGVGTAPPGSLSRPVPTNPNSLNALTGRNPTAVPWTRALRWLIVASIVVVALAALAFQRAFALAHRPAAEPPPKKKPTHGKRKPAR
jgi:plastocyanin